jgi:hypothetical protein
MGLPSQMCPELGESNIMSLVTFAHSNIHIRITTEKAIAGKTKRQYKTAEQKSKESMQPCDELAAIFGVGKKPSISRTKL